MLSHKIIEEKNIFHNKKICLYEESLLKWKNILKEFRENILSNSNFYYYRCMTPCVFCRDSNCSECLINHDICDKSGHEGLMKKGKFIVNTRKFRKWILNMIESLQLEIKKLKKNSE